MAKKIKNLGEFSSSSEAWKEALNLSHIVTAANKHNKKQHKLSVHKGSYGKYFLWLEQEQY